MGALKADAWALTRRSFLQSAAGDACMIAIGAIGIFSTGSGALISAGSEEDYVLVNGWVLNRADVQHIWDQF